MSTGAIHFSTLTGRILIKDLRYHSSNQTFRIVKLQLSWRYWLRQPAEEEDLSHARVIGEEANGKHGSPLACRVHLSLQGLEWFVYNRTAAFDNIVSQLDVDLPATPAATPLPDGGASVRKIFSRTSVFHDCTFSLCPHHPSRCMHIICVCLDLSHSVDSWSTCLSGLVHIQEDTDLHQTLCQLGSESDA